MRSGLIPFNKRHIRRVCSASIPVSAGRGALPRAAGVLARLGLLLGLLLTDAHPALSNGAGDSIINPELAGGSRWLVSEDNQTLAWQGDAELGYLSTTGNAITEAAHTRWRIQHRRTDWLHTLRFEALVVREQGLAPAEQYKASEKSAYYLTARGYLFERIRFERIPALRFHYRWSEVVGYGRLVYQSQTLALYLEAGPGSRQTRLTDALWQNEMLLLFSGEVEWSIGPAANCNVLLNSEQGEVNTVTNLLSSLTLQFNNSFSAKLSYDVTHNTDVPAGLRNTDSNTTVALVYRF